MRKLIVILDTATLMHTDFFSGHGHIGERDLVACASAFIPLAPYTKEELKEEVLRDLIIDEFDGELSEEEINEVEKQIAEILDDELVDDEQLQDNYVSWRQDVENNGDDPDEVDAPYYIFYFHIYKQ